MCDRKPYCKCDKKKNSITGWLVWQNKYGVGLLISSPHGNGWDEDGRFTKWVNDNFGYGKEVRITIEEL